MKVYKYYKKDSRAIYAVTDIKKLAEEFELIYDMDKFVKEVCDMEKNDYNYGLYNGQHFWFKNKLWVYTLNSKDCDSFSVCMTEQMNDLLKNASDNIIYTFKSAYVTTLKYRETECLPIDNEYLSSIYEIAYSKDFKIDTYKIWIDLFADIIRDTVKKDAVERSVDTSMLLGVYKYDFSLKSRYEDEDIVYPNLYDSY